MGADDEEGLLRSAALQTATSILQERRRIERELADERERLRITLASIGDAVISTDADGRVRFLNGVAEDLTGWPQAEAAGRPLPDIFHIVNETTRAPVENPALRALREGRVVGLANHTILIARGGAERPIDDSAAPMRDRAGAAVGAVLVFRDVTERKRAEEALRESEGRHRFLADLAAATQPLTDPGAVMGTTARLLAEYLGVARCAYAEVEAEAVFVITGDYCRGVPSIVGRWPVAAFGPALEPLMRANEPYVVTDVDADPRAGPDLTAYRQTDIRAVICVPLYKAGKFAAAMAVHATAPRHWTAAEVELVRTVVARCWESLERARTARGLRETADRLALALSAASLGVWSWDAATDLVMLSDRAAEVFGIPTDHAPTWAWLRGLLHADDRERARREVERAVAARDAYHVDYRVLRHGGGEVWVSARGRAQYDPDGRALGMFGVVQDITDRKRAEAATADADRRKDEFLATLAHELRNPLAPVRTGLQILGQTADAAAAARVRGMMDRQLAHTVRLIDDLMDVSRITTGKVTLRRERVALQAAVEVALEASRPQIEAARHALAVDLAPDPAWVDADITRITQVVTNLLTNAAKYTPEGGRITLAAGRDGDRAVVRVTDTGLGIPADMLAEVFEMFTQVNRTLDRSQGGLGIGLALVKRLVEMHGGTIAAASPGPGRGSTFTVRLPLAADDPAAAPPAATAERSPPGRLRVLVVDDNVDAADSLAMLLDLSGHETRAAYSGLAALDVVRGFVPDVAFLDLGLPGMDGHELARRFRQDPTLGAVTLVALTGWGSPDDRQKTRAAGFDHHVTKPAETAEVERLLGSIAAGRDRVG